LPLAIFAHPVRYFSQFRKFEPLLLPVREIGGIQEGPDHETHAHQRLYTRPRSLAVADRLIEEIGSNRPSLEIDRFDLHDGTLPAFDGHAVEAKMALFTGDEATADERRAWEGIKAVFDRFAAADVYVFSVPLWNNGVPYILKQFIDVVTQPGWAFGFDPETGYSGLLTGKRAFVVHASGVFHEGIAPGFGADFATPYLADWLRFIGVGDVDHIHVAPTVVNADYAAIRAAAEATAVRKAGALTGA
jgi:FMN-dependent NADH-azoreductase